MNEDTTFVNAIPNPPAGTWFVRTADAGMCRIYPKSHLESAERWAQEYDGSVFWWPFTDTLDEALTAARVH